MRTPAGGTVEEPCLYVKKTHSDCSVTNISVKDGLVYSTGRDGAVNTWKIDKGDVGGRWKLVNQNTIKLWGGIDDLHGVVWRGGGSMCVYGFEHTDFVLWDVQASPFMCACMHTKKK